MEQLCFPFFIEENKKNEEAKRIQENNQKKRKRSPGRTPGDFAHKKNELLRCLKQKCPLKISNEQLGFFIQRSEHSVAKYLKALVNEGCIEIKITTIKLNGVFLSKRMIWYTGKEGII